MRLPRALPFVQNTLNAEKEREALYYPHNPKPRVPRTNTTPEEKKIDARPKRDRASVIDVRLEGARSLSGMLLGAGHSVLRGKMPDYEFLRIEPRSDGIFFSQFGGDRNETSFRLDKVVSEDKDTIFTFANTADAFPARLIYRRGTEGWLYETIEGKMNGSDRQVIYPVRRVDCETGELINK